MKLQTSKEERETWAHALWPERKKKVIKPKATSDAKKRRLEKLVELHEHSNLNSEAGLTGIISLRKMLQSPTKLTITDEGRLALKFAIEEGENILKLEEQIDNLPGSPVFRFALEFHLGVFSLYHAQVWPSSTEINVLGEMELSKTDWQPSYGDA